MFSFARGLAFFLGTCSLLNLLARCRAGEFDPNRWWIDFGRLPRLFELVIMTWLVAAVLAWGISPRMSSIRRSLTVAVLVLAIGVALIDSATCYHLLWSGKIRSSFAVPFSLAVVLAMGIVAWAVLRRPEPLRLVPAAGACILCAIGFPLAQIACYGTTDYRRPADAIVVFGARAYADGRPSDALEDRMLTAIQLYQQGLAGRLIVSGGPGDGALSESQVMRNMAVSRGIPESAVTIDENGLTTDATVRNVPVLLGRGRTVLAVSHAWHLPRIKLRFEHEGIRAFTVPADERGQFLRNTPYLVAREVPAMWLYWLRAVAGR